MKITKKFTVCLLAAMLAMLLLTSCEDLLLDAMTGTGTHDTGTVTVKLLTNNSSYGTVSGGGIYDYGTSATVTATANSGYIFTGWQKNGEIISTEESYTFTVSSDYTMIAVFAVSPTYTSIPSDEVSIDEEHFPDATFRSLVSTNFDE